MSELKVNTISGIAGSVKVNDPVGIGAVAKSGYDLNVDGKVNLEGSVEVITVPASNFGVRIRAPLTATTSPGFGDSTLQFTNNQGTTEWASLHAKSDASLDIRTDGDSALTINNAQVINHLGASLFTNTATFNNSVRVNGQAIFDNTVIPRCGGVPTVGDQLANKTYVDDQLTKKSIKYYFVPQAGIPVGTWVDLRNFGVPRGAWMVKICVRLHTGQGPDVTTLQTRVAAGETGAGTLISGARAIAWIAALGSSDNAGAQMSGEVACAGSAGFSSHTELFVSYANYGAFIDGYWA